MQLVLENLYHFVADIEIQGCYGDFEAIEHVKKIDKRRK